MADDRGVLAQRTDTRQQVQRDLPRLAIVFRLWQCDKENHGWREGPPLTVSAKFRSAGRAFTLPVKSVSNEKRILLSITRQDEHSEDRPVIVAFPENDVSPCRLARVNKRKTPDTEVDEVQPRLTATPPGRTANYN